MGVVDHRVSIFRAAHGCVSPPQYMLSATLGSALKRSAASSRSNDRGVGLYEWRAWQGEKSVVQTELNL